MNSNGDKRSGLAVDPQCAKRRKEEEVEECILLGEDVMSAGQGELGFPLGFVQPAATSAQSSTCSSIGHLLSVTTPWLFSQDLGYSLFTLASWFSIGFLLSSLFRNLVNSWLFSLAHLGIYENEEWSH